MGVQTPDIFEQKCFGLIRFQNALDLKKESPAGVAKAPALSGIGKRLTREAAQQKIKGFDPGDLMNVSLRVFVEIQLIRFTRLGVDLTRQNTLRRNAVLRKRFGRTDPDPSDPCEQVNQFYHPIFS